MVYGDGAHFLPANEENEEQMFIMHTDLYRFDKDSSLWKYICSGPVKLMRHAETRQLRLVMMDRTLKIHANHLVLPGMKVLPKMGRSRRCCTWRAADEYVADDGPLKHQLFCLRFPTLESRRIFMAIFNGKIDDGNIVDEKRDVIRTEGFYAAAVRFSRLPANVAALERREELMRFPATFAVFGKRTSKSFPELLDEFKKHCSEQPELEEYRLQRCTTCADLLREFIKYSDI
ncbi:hypothetical protein PTKIN_Ptkin03bG0018800 [Pterospermum kingtungense]